MSLSVEKNWLTLGQASRLLGIHPSTLRAWVDAGMVHAFLTPGGHRRFEEPELRTFLESRRADAALHIVEPAPERTLEQVRDQLRHVEMAQQSWYARLSDADRIQHRGTGARLLGLLLQYVSHRDDNERYLSEAREVAQDYGRNFARTQSSVSELAQAFLFFRRMIVRAAFPPAANRGLKDVEGLRLVESIDEFMDELLIATLDTYDQVTLHTNSRDAHDNVANPTHEALHKPSHAAKP